MAMSALVRMLLAITVWVALPLPKHLPAQLVVGILAPFFWTLGFTLRCADEISPMALIEHMLYFFVFSIVLYSTCRHSELEARRAYMNSRMTRADLVKKNQEIRKLKHHVTKLSSEAFFDGVLDEERKKISNLQDSLDNYDAKRQMQELHDQLMADYVCLGASNPEGFSDAELAITGIEERFGKLKVLAQQESQRLAKIMDEVHKVFSELPEWEPVPKLPSFVDFDRDPLHPKEKLHQTSRCKWWIKPELYPPSLSRIGIAKEPLQWFACRSQWAKAPFVDILKKVVSDFNKASTPNDLGLTPNLVMRKWNEHHPNHQLKDVPFPEGLSLDSEIAATKQHDYIESGKHAGLQVGPTKDRLRIMAKVAEYAAEPDNCPDSDCLEKYVTDWLRARVVFVNPAALAVFFWFVVTEVPKLKVIVCKNKLKENPGKDTSCCIHLNVQFDVQGEKHVGELQLILESFCMAKDLEHKYYEFKRADCLADILAPILAKVPPRPPAPDQTQATVSVGVSSTGTTGSKGVGSRWKTIKITPEQNAGQNCDAVCTNKQPPEAPELLD